MNLTEAYLLLVVMLAVVAVASVLFRGKIGLITPVIFVAGLVTALVGGMGFRLREVTEGPFAFVDSTMWVLCGAAFIYLLYANGTFQYLFEKVISKKRGPAAQMFLLVLFIALPGMFTGTALASVATTGLMAGRYLLDKGVEKSKVVEVVAVSALFGMLLPPLCLPGMAFAVARQSLYPGAFEGYFLPLLIVTVPALIVYSALSGRRILGDVEAESDLQKTGSPICLIPLIVVAVLVLGYNFLYFVIPYYGGYPVIYIIGFILALIFKVKSANPLTSAADGIHAVALEMAMVLAYASVVEVFNLMGVNGTIAAQLAIADVNAVVVTLALAALTLVGGILLGAPFAYTIGALATYQCSNSNYGNHEMVMLGLGVVLALTMFLSLRGGLTDLTAEQLEVKDVTGPQVAKRNVIPVLVVLVIAVAYLATGGTLKFLMI